MTSPQRGNEIFGLIFLFNIIVVSAFLRVLWESNLNTSYMHLTVIHLIVGYFIPFLIYKYATKQSFKLITPIRAMSLKNVLFVIGIIMCAIPFGLFLQSVIVLFFHNPYVFLYYQIMDYHFLLWILVIAVSPSIFEEIVFRGIIQHEYKGVPIKKAALINGMLFGILHFNMVQFFIATFLGVILAYFMHYTRSILAPMLGHFVWNLTAITIVYVLHNSAASSVDIFSGYFLEPTTDIIILGVVSIVLAVPFIMLMKKFISYNKHNEQHLIEETN